MSSEPITDSPDPRLQAALAEYLERIDRGEAVDREAFLAEFPDLARELAPLLETADALEEIGGNSGESRPPDLSTHSQLSHDIETVAPGRQGQEATTSGPLPVEFGRYRTIKPLGQGAMGVVYLAEDTQLHRKVALKTSSFDNDQSGELLERFYREARSAATLRHPNICPVYDVGEIQGRHYISMAYIEGRTLATYVNASGSLHERQVLVLVRKLALALQDAHQHEIVHRDLKPANIMVDLKGEPIIMDFGLARVGYSEEESRLTQVGMIVGSPAYMSPEQVGGRPEQLTGAADQYSLGVILFELLVGHPPFRGPVTAVVGQILTQPPPRLSSLRSDVSPAVEALCLKMLAKSPSERFASMKHVAEEIATLLRGSSTEKGPAGREDRATPATSIPKTSLHAALVDEARQRLKQRDYPKAIEMLQQIPEADRPPEAAKLLAQALKLMDEVNFVLQEMEAALQSRDGATLAKRAQELVKLKPDHPRARQVRELIKKHGPERALQFLAENSGTTPAPPPPRRLFVGGLAAGLALLFAIVWFQFGDSRVKVEVLAEGYEVKFNEAEITITDGTRETKVKPGEHTLHIKSLNPGDGGTVEEFDTEKLTLKKGGQAVLTVTRENAEVVAKLDGQVIPRRSLTGPAPPDKHQIDTASSYDSAEKTPIFQTSEELIENSNGAKAQPAGSVGWKVVSGQWNLPDSSENVFADPNAGFFAGNVSSGVLEQVVDVSRFADAIDSANVEFKLSWKLACFDADVGAVALTSLDSDRKEMATAYDSGWQNHQPWNSFKRFESSIAPAKGVRYFRLRVSSQRSGRPGNVQCSANFREISLRAVVKQPFTPPQVSDDGPWVSLFNGKDLTNWKLHADQPGGWAVEDGLLVGRSWDANHLFTERGDFENFHLRAELKTEHQSNGGIKIRSPFALDHSGKFPSGYEAQILHSHATGPWTGSLKTPGVPTIEQLPHERPVLAAGEWFTMDVIAVGNILTVKVNGKTTTNIRDGSNLYPQGHIALQAMVEAGITTPTIIHFKKIEVKRLKMANTAAPETPKPSAVPEGEIDLLAAVDVSQLGDADMKWERKGQTIVCTGTGAAGKSAWKGFRLPTEIGGDYEVELEFQQRAFWPMQIDFPLQDTVLRVSLTGDYCDLMIEEDKTQPNAEKTWRSRAATLKTMVPQKLVVRVRQSGTRAEIEATLDGVTLGTYSGERSRLVLPSWVNPNFKQITSGSLCGNLAEGYIELRKAVYRPLAPVSEEITIPSKVATSAVTNSDSHAVPISVAQAALDGWTDLFNGRDLTGWTPMGFQGWRVEKGVLIGETQDAQGWLMSNTEYDNCEFDFEYRLGPGTNGGVFLRAWADGPVSGKDFLEVQLLDESDEVFRTMPPSRRTGALYDILEARSLADLRPNLWHRMNIAIHEQEIRVSVNGQEVTRGKLPVGKQPHGHLGLQLSPRTKPQKCEFQKLRVRPLKDGLPVAGAHAQPNEPMAKIEPIVEPAEPDDPNESDEIEEVRSGLKAEIFAGQNFERKVTEKIEPNLDCFWNLAAPAVGVPVDGFSVRFSGWLKAPRSGRYKIGFWSDDGLRVSLDGKKVIDDWKVGAHVREASVELTDQPQSILVETFDLGGPAHLTAYWLPTGQATPCLIPSEAFFPTEASARAPAAKSTNQRQGLIAEYFDLPFQRKYATHRVIRAETTWFTATPTPGLPTALAARYSGYVVPPTTGQYKLVGLGDDWMRVWIDNKPALEAKFEHGIQTALISLDAGKAHAIRIEHANSYLDGEYFLHWVEPGKTEEVSIPPECLFPTKAAANRAASKQPSIKTPEKAVEKVNTDELPEVRHGLKAEVFEGRNFEKKVGEQIEPNVECFWELGAPSKDAPVDNFSVRFTGWLRAPKTGRYKLFLSSKDGSRLKINHQTLIDNWKLKPDVAEVSLELTQDPQPIEVEVFNADLYSWVSLLWQPAGTATVCHIPTTALYPDVENARSKANRTNIEKTGLVAEYFDKSFGRRLATDRVYRIEEIWGPHSPRWGLPTDSAAKYTGILVPPVSGQYKLVTSARGHIRVWIDDKPTVEAKGIQTAQNAVVELEANKPYEIRVEVLTTSHGAHYLHWIPPGTTKEVSIPPEYLFPNKAAVRQVTNGPVIKAPTVEKPAPNTISAAERETIERGLAQLKAADEAAGKKLLKAFDEQIEKARTAPKIPADERVVRIKSLEDEKALFEKHGHIPFSLAMRTETLKYLREFTEARTDTAKVYDKLIESLTKQKKDGLASLLRTERDIAVGPKVVATWRTTEINGGRMADWTIWSNGSVGKPDRQFLWMMDESRFRIQWRPDPQWIDTLVVGPDSMKANIYNAKREHTINGERVAP